MADSRLQASAPERNERELASALRAVRRVAAMAKRQGDAGRQLIGLELRNLRRRQLLPSESFKAVKRLYELNGIEGPGSRGDLTGATVAQVAKELGKSERTVKTMRTLADLIPPLAAMLDAIERDKPRSVYCTQNNEDCATCSLSSYGMDCHGHPFDYGDPDKDD